MTIEQTSRNPDPSEPFRPHKGVLLECRDFVSQRVREALARAVGEVDAELQGRRGDATSGDESQRLIELQVLIRRVGADLDRAFSTGFDKQFQERAGAASPAGDFYQKNNGFFPELSLVEESVIDESLMVRNLSARLERNCEAESHDLQTRVAFMLGENDIDNTNNPIGPMAICETLKSICWSQDAAGELRAAVLEMLVSRLTSDISTVYHDVNALLVSRKVMPNVRARAKRGKAVQRIAARRNGAPGQEDDAADIVKQLFSARAAAELPDWKRRTGAADLMQLLSGLQRGQSDVGLGGQEFSIEPEAAASGNVITRLVEAGLGKHVGTLDGIIIDVVATLFDYIFDDSRIPDAMKGLIGRLQIPVLKLAMMDHGFFANRGHPARRLINALAQAGVTWDGPLEADSTLYRTAEAIVVRIQNEFSEDAEVFASCLQQFETYLVDQERNADARAATLTDRLKERERQELARQVARDSVAGLLANEAIPQVVRSFIEGTWIKVLAAASLETAGGSEPAKEGERWREAMATVDELVWSVLPMQGAESRQLLVKRLPGILQNVKAGMRRVSMDEAAQKAFFAELVQCHAAAMKAAPAAPAATTGAPAAAPRPAGRASTFRPPDEEPTPELLELDLLSRGSWVELKDESGDIRRMRLTWISPARTMYLFANRQGVRALALTRDELKRRFANGEARTADQEPLLDRVVDDVLDELRG
ncbi:DUF1631 domain-containing protein [Azoarcus sp. KH32C]|uniref:DUF1631 domain-containing protein n=1 Tax=Azoarcus sp. KH32C TaxID=748247 RepID=UPI0002386EBE|nr:DUF1631 domain-containing protein [Azoarcus sp. KH32C]BAL24438.1 hypothetical protein AZKH_2125 [Azoarcus sp. KH32C]